MSLAAAVALADRVNFLPLALARFPSGSAAFCSVGGASVAVSRLVVRVCRLPSSSSTVGRPGLGRADDLARPGLALVDPLDLGSHLDPLAVLIPQLPLPGAATGSGERGLLLGDPRGSQPWSSRVSWVTLRRARTACLPGTPAAWSAGCRAAALGLVGHCARSTSSPIHRFTAGMVPSSGYSSPPRSSSSSGSGSTCSSAWRGNLDLGLALSA